MSKDFLGQVLRNENLVVSYPSPICHICMQRCGELSPETGVIECGIRLPCSHIFGSACIATWLQTKNTCPMCRQTFFLQDSYEVEDGSATNNNMSSVDGNEEAENEEDDEDDEDDQIVLESLERFCTVIHARLDLSYRELDIARAMVGHLYRADYLSEHASHCLAAVTMYMVSHLMDKAKSLDEISRVSHESSGHIRRFYEDIYSNRERLIPGNLLVELSKIDQDGFLAHLPAPRAQDGTLTNADKGGSNHKVTDGDLDQTNDCETEGELYTEENEIYNPGQLEILCRELCVEVNYDDYAYEVSLLARRIGQSLETGYPPEVLVVVGIFITSHLIGDPWNSLDLSNLFELAEETIQAVYDQIYSNRRDLINYTMIEMTCRLNPNRALQAVSPLAWPPL